MSSLPTVIFDFDGTIADTMVLVFTIYNQLAPEFNCRPVTEEDGLVLRSERPQVFFRKHGLSLIKMPQFALRVKKEIGKHIAEIKPFPGVIDLIKSLNEHGYTLGIVSSNDTDNINKFLSVTVLDSYFSFVVSGNNLFGKDKILRKVMKQRALSPDAIIYIGDETRDIDAVKKVGIPIISATWGYSTRDLLESLHPNALADHPSDIPALIDKLTFCR